MSSQPPDRSGPAPVAPGRHPLIGHVITLARRPLKFLEGLSAIGDVVRVDLGHRPVYVVTTPELVRELLLVNVASFERGLIYERARAVFGNGLATSSGDVHRQHRKLVQPAFTRHRVAGYAGIMGRRAEMLAGSWHAGQLVQLDAEMDLLSLDIVVDALFSSELSRGAAADVRRLVPVIIQGLLPGMVMPAGMRRYLPLPSIRRFDAAAIGLRAVVLEVIARYCARQRNVATNDPADLLSVLLQAGQDGRLEPEDVCDEVVSLLMAGTETLASALCWMFHELAANPAVEQQLHTELDAVVAGAPVTFADVPRLETTGRIIEEVLRLHSPLLFTRRALVEVELGGVRLPPGTEVAFSPYALHRDPAAFARPTDFDPDRWLPDRAAELPRSGFSPFSVGAHRCIGDGYARTALVVITATLASRWRLRPPPGTVVRAVVAEIPRPATLPMIVEPRHAGCASPDQAIVDGPGPSSPEQSTSPRSPLAVGDPDRPYVVRDGAGGVAGRRDPGERAASSRHSRQVDGNSGRTSHGAPNFRLRTGVPESGG